MEGFVYFYNGGGVKKEERNLLFSYNRQNELYKIPKQNVQKNTTTLPKGFHPRLCVVAHFVLVQR